MSEKTVLQEKDITIAKALIDIIKCNGGKTLLTYGRLSELVNDKGVECNAHFVYQNLDRINKWCLLNDAPMISVVVISQDTGRPESGFYDLYRSNHSAKQSCKSDEEIFISEWKHIRDYKEWDKVFEGLI